MHLRNFRMEETDFVLLEQMKENKLRVMVNI